MKRTVVITGASRGLGLSLSRKFLECGTRVVGLSHTRKAWKQAMASVPKGAPFELHQVDVSVEKEVAAFAKRILRRGPVDVLINNAGYGGGLSEVQDLSLKEYDKLIRDNLTSAFLMSKHFIPAFRRQGRGLIINVSSMAGVRAVPRLFGYSAAKFGMLALSQCIAKENQETGVQCITVCPGGMNTEMRAAIFGKKDAARQQTTDFVASVMMDAVEGRFPVASGSSIVIRHGKIFSVQPPPAA